MSDLRLDDTTVAFRLHGIAGPQLSLVHGGLVASPSWKHQLPDDERPALAREMRLVTHDQRGYGATPYGGPEDGLGRMTDDLIALWDMLELERVVAVGFSMGSMVVLDAVARVPERVAGVVLIGSGILSERSRESFLARADAVEAGVFEEQIGEHARRAFSPAWADANPRALAAYADEARRADPRAVVQTFRGIAAWEPPDVTACDVPAVLINGELDGLFTPTAARDLAAHLRRADTRVVPGAGHTVHYERPDIVNPLVEGFVGELEER